MHCIYSSVPPSAPRLTTFVNGQRQNEQVNRLRVHQGDSIRLECDERNSFPAAVMRFEVTVKNPHNPRRRQKKLLGREEVAGSKVASFEFTAQASSEYNGAVFRCSTDNVAMSTASSTASSEEAVLEVLCKREILNTK